MRSRKAFKISKLSKGGQEDLLEVKKSYRRSRGAING